MSISRKGLEAFMNEAKVLYSDSGEKQIYIRLSGGFEVCKNSDSLLKTKDIDRAVEKYNEK